MITRIKKHSVSIYTQQVNSPRQELIIITEIDENHIERETRRPPWVMWRLLARKRHRQELEISILL